MAYNPQNPNGQATMANSEPVVLASDQSAIPISGTVTATNLDIRDLVFATDKVDVSGSTGVGVTGTFWQATQPVSGTFWQATQPVSLTSTTITGTVAVTQSGTWILGANSGVDIGDVTINNAAGASAVNIQDGGNSITVDGTVAFSNSTIAVTNAGTFAVQLTGATNNINNISGTITLPTGASTLAEQQTQTTSLQLIDDVVYTDDTSTHSTGVTKGVGIMATATPTDASVNANDIGMVAMTTDRKLHVSVQDALPTGSNVIGAVTQSGTWTVTANAGTNLNTSTLVQLSDFQAVFGALSLRTTTQGDGINDTVDSLNSSSLSYLYNGTSWDRMRGNTTDGLLVNLGANNDVTITSISAGTNYIGKVRLTDGTTDGEVVPLAGYNAQAVAIVDGSGNQITSFGGGTQYTEDAAAAADPVGTVPILVRADTPSTTVTTDGDNIAQRGTNYGAAYVTLLDTGGSPVSVGGGTQYTEDVASTADPIGTQLIARRRDALSTETTTDGDNTAVNSTGKGELYVKHVDTIPVTQSGNWSVRLQDGSGNAIASTTGALSVQVVNAPTATIDNPGGGSAVNIQDGGNSITVDGTIAFSNTTIAVTNAGTFAVQVDGAALTSLQLIDDIVYTDDTSTHSTGVSKGVLMMAAATPTDTAVNANDIGALAMTLNRELLVQVNTALPTGANVIGAVTQSGTWSTRTQDGSGNALTSATRGSERALSVQLVDASGTQITSFGGGTSYTEDVASAADPVGGMMMGVVDTGNDDTVSTDSDNMAIRLNANGAPYTSQTSQVWPASVAMQTAAAANGNGTLMDVRGYNSAILTIIGASTPAMTVNFEGSMDDSVWFVVQSQSVLTDFNSGPAVTPSTSTIPYRINTQGLKSIRARISSYISGNATVVGYRLPIGSTTMSAVVQTTIASGPLSVQIDGGLGVFSGVVDETGASSVNAVGVGGGTPHDSVDSGNPIKIGGRAIAHGTNPTAVAAADRSDIYTNRAGIPFVIGGHPNIVSAEYFTSGAQTDDPVIAVVSSGTKIVVTSITVTCSAANATSPSVRIGFGTASVPAQGASGADGVAKVILSHPGIPAGGGIQKGTGSGIVGIGGDGDDLRITCTTPTTSLIVQVDYYTIES